MCLRIQKSSGAHSSVLGVVCFTAALWKGCVYEDIRAGVDVGFSLNPHLVQ